MTVDRVVKIGESEKCGLDMSCYEDLHSADDVGNVSHDCSNNGDGGKDDYVFVNGSDAASSDDQVENREVNGAALGVEGNDTDNEAVVGEESAGGVKPGKEVVVDREIESGSEVVGVGNAGNENLGDAEVSVRVSDETKRSDQVADEVNEEADLDQVKEVEPVLETDTPLDSSFDVGPEIVVDEVNGGCVQEPVVDQLKGDSVVDQVKEVEPVFETGENDTLSVDSIASRSLNIDHEQQLIVGEVNEGCAQEPAVDTVDYSCVQQLVLDQAKASSFSEPAVEQVKDVELVCETRNDGIPSVDSIVPLSLDVDQELVADEVNEGCAHEPALDEVSEACAQQLVLDQSKASSFSEPTVEKVKGIESVCETVNNGIPSVDSIAPLSLDVDQEPVLDEVDEGCTQEPGLDEVNEGCTQEPDLDEVNEGCTQELALDEANEGCAQQLVLDQSKASSFSESAVEQVKDVESVCEAGNNGTVSVDSIAPRSLDVNLELAVDEINEGCVQEPVVDQVKETSDPQPIVDQTEDAKSVVETGNTGAPSVNSIGARSLDVDDNSENSVFDTQISAQVDAENSVSDAPEPYVVEAQNNAPSAEVPEGELEAEQHIVLPLENGIMVQESETGRLEDQAGTLKASENIGDGHGVELPVAEVQSLDVRDQSAETSLAELQSLDGDVKSSLSQDVEDKGRLQPDNRKNEKQDLVEVEANTEKQGDVDPIAAGGIQKSVNSDAAGCELEQSVEPEETSDVQYLPNQSEGAKNLRDLELAATGMDNPASVIVSQSDGNRIELTSRVEDIGGVSVDRQFDTTAKSVLEGELEGVDGDVESKVITESGGSREASAETNGLQGQGTGSSGVVDNEISSEDFSSEKSSTVDDTSSSKLHSADNTAIDARDNVSENKVVPALDESSEDVGTGLISEYNESKTETVKSEIDVGYKSNNVYDATIRAQISFGSFGCISPTFSHNDVNLGSDLLYKSTAVSTAKGETLSFAQTNGDHADELKLETGSAKIVRLINEVSPLSKKGSEADSTDGQNFNPDLVRRPFYWLIKVPRFDEGKFKDQLSQCEIELAEKTKARDTFQADINKQQAYCRELKSIRDAANSEVKAARELMWAKSRDIDSAHSLINLARHAITVEDIDKKIFNLERTLQHQTLNNLREEKELVREIKQLNLQRQKLLADPQRQQEVQQAHDQRGQTEEHLKVLKKELDALRDNLSKVDEHFRAAKKKHDDESALLNDLKHQLRSADDIRQEAYAHLIKLKKQLNEKNAPFYKAKNDLRVAYNYATAGKKDSLESYCINQVEKLMEMWNTNDEFRKEYIQCNTRRVLWKFGTLDGTRLGIDEVPPSLGNGSTNKINTSTKDNSATTVLSMERDFPVAAKTTEDKLPKKPEQKKAPPSKEIESISKNSVAKASVVTEIEENTEEPKLTKEEEELARKAEQLWREEEAVRLREQLRLEEKAKADEALERKRRNALKAQARAEFKARKEAEAKEKEREKRAKKKEKKRGGLNLENSENVAAQPSEPSIESPKEPEITERSSTIAKRPQKASLHSKPIKTTKPIPPALRNKNRRGFLRYWPYPCVVLLAIALFYLGSVERIQTIKQHIWS